MKIAIIGAGNVGKTLGAARNVKSISGALAAAQVVILATPWIATEALVCEHAGALAGKIVIDATNPVHPSLARLAVASNSSGVELLQSQARTAKFFKAFNSTGVEVMAKPNFAEGNAAMFVAGPDGPDKKTVLRLIEDVGFEPVDAGELKTARSLEHLAMLWIQLALTKGHGRDFAFVMARRQHAANRNAESRVRMVHPRSQKADAE